jgi:hypothetical protein
MYGYGSSPIGPAIREIIGEGIISICGKRKELVEGE